LIEQSVRLPNNLLVGGLAFAVDRAGTGEFIAGAVVDQPGLAAAAASSLPPSVVCALAFFQGVRASSWRSEHRPEVAGTRRDLDPQQGLDGVRVGQGVPDRGVVGDGLGQEQPPPPGESLEALLDALVHVREPELEVEHRLAGHPEPWGFAPEGASVHRTSCDTQDLLTPTGDSDKRRCWHQKAGTLFGGWRCGDETGLKGSAAFERVVLTAE